MRCTRRPCRPPSRGCPSARPQSKTTSTSLSVMFLQSVSSFVFLQTIYFSFVISGPSYFLFGGRSEVYLITADNEIITKIDEQIKPNVVTGLRWAANCKLESSQFSFILANQVIIWIFCTLTPLYLAGTFIFGLFLPILGPIFV